MPFMNPYVGGNMRKLMLNEDTPDVLIDDERLVHDKEEENVDDELKDLYKEKEKVDKEVQKELKKRVDSVDDDINNAETPKPEAKDGSGKNVKIDGYNTPTVKIGEKLILPEPDGILNEDVPKALQGPYKTAYDKKYNHTKYNPEDAVGDVTVDWAGSSLPLVTPEQAELILKKKPVTLVDPKTGEEVTIEKPDKGKLRIVCEGKLVTINPATGAGDTIFRNYAIIDSDKFYTAKDKSLADDTRKMPGSHIIKIADMIDDPNFKKPYRNKKKDGSPKKVPDKVPAIFYALEEPDVDKSMVSKRRENPETGKSFTYNDRMYLQQRSPAVGIFNDDAWADGGDLGYRHSDNVVRGTKTQDTWLSRGKVKAKELKDTIKKARRELKNLKEKEPSLTPEQKGEHSKAVTYWSGMLADAQQRLAHFEDERDLQAVTRRAADIDGEIGIAARNYDSAKRDLDYWTANGSPETQQAQKDLYHSEKQLRNLRNENELAYLNAQFEDEDRAKLGKTLDNNVALSKKALDRANAKHDKLLGRDKKKKDEDLDEAFKIKDKKLLDKLLKSMNITTLDRKKAAAGYNTYNWEDRLHQLDASNLKAEPLTKEQAIEMLPDESESSLFDTDDSAWERKYDIDGNRYYVNKETGKAPNNIFLKIGDD